MNNSIFKASRQLRSLFRVLCALTVLFFVSGPCLAGGRVYVWAWFHTEDYVEPAADDATLRLAEELRGRGVRATFKLVGEKVRALESRGRQDVIRALSFHDIGYHGDNHSIPPAPAVYLRDMGWLDGAAEFERRERPGVADLRRIFGMTPSCYASPGNSWGPQSLRALLRLGIPVNLRGAGAAMPQLYWFRTSLETSPGNASRSTVGW